MKTKVLLRPVMLLLLYAFSPYKVYAQAMFNYLNNVPKHVAQYKGAVTQLSTAGSGMLSAKVIDVNTPIIGVTSPIGLNPVITAILAANKDVTIKYGVPGLAWIDRWLFGIKFREREAEFIDTQNFYRYTWSGPDYVKNEMVNLMQREIDRLASILYVVQTDGAWVDFDKYPGRSRVNAEVRYNGPMGRQYPLMQANNGVVNFHNIPYSSIDGNPVIGVLEIYK